MQIEVSLMYVKNIYKIGRLLQIAQKYLGNQF